MNPKDKKISASKENDPNTLKVMAVDGKSTEKIVAEMSLSPIVANAKTASVFAQSTFGVIDIGEAVVVMCDKTKKVQAGDLSDLEATLTAQVVTLDAMFNNLAKRAINSDYMQKMDTYLRLALKAQSQSRTTVEAIAEIKYPKSATFIKQANIAGQQQVNNGDAENKVNANASRTHAHTHGKTLNQSNELLEAQHGERLDAGASGTASGNDSQLETLGTINGS